MASIVVDDITIGEGMITRNPNDMATPAHPFATLDYKTLERRYGITTIHVFQRPFETFIDDETGELPLTLAKQGIKGLFYPKPDDTMCTCCPQFNGPTLTAIRLIWKGQAREKGIDPMDTGYFN